MHDFMFTHKLLAKEKEKKEEKLQKAESEET